MCSWVTIKESLKGPAAISSFIVSIAAGLKLTSSAHRKRKNSNPVQKHRILPPDCEHTVCRVSSPLEAYFNGEALAIAVLLRAAVADYV
jgi:hypothetical protein